MLVFKSVYTYKASECKRAIIRLHCATSKSSLWYMGYVPRGGAVERPRIYRTRLDVTLVRQLDNTGTPLTDINSTCSFSFECHVSAVCLTPPTSGVTVLNRLHQ